MRKSLLCFIAAITCLHMACNRDQNNQAVSDLSKPKIIKAKSFSVSLDSVPPPVVFPVRNVRPVKAGKPKIVKVISNKHKLSKPFVVSAGKPAVRTPGTNGYSLLKKIPAVDSTFIAGLPDVVIAKDPQSSDNNPGNFSGFKILQGLEENIIFSLLQDRNGNLWIGTWRGGVSKYDGRTFTNYSMKQGMGSDYVMSLLEDNKGNLWFGTWNGGVTRFNGRTFTNYSTRQGLINDVVLSIYEDGLGNIWFGTEGGISKYDGTTFTNFTDKQGLQINKVTSILQDPNGNMWFGLLGGGFCKFDGGSFSNYTTTQGLIDNRIEHIMIDSKGN